MTARDLHALLAHAADPRSDADLVADAADPAALTILVRRHGPLVWGTCRRMLPNPADAADAFQAVFLALAKTHHRIRTPAAVGGWLHAAAVKVCLKQRRTLARRRLREQRAARPEATTPVADAAWDAMLAAVHEEIDQLPDGERTAFVLCELQGVPAGEAARRLGWKPGTLTGRLSKARAKLLTRLSARGLAPAVGLTGVGTLAVPAEVLALAGPAASVSPAVVALSTEITAMVTTKHLAAAVLVTVGLLAGAGGVALRADGEEGGGGQPPNVAEPKKAEAKFFPPNPALVAGVDYFPEPLKPAAGPVRWEYAYEPKPERRDEFTRLVNSRGQEGWELATITTVFDQTPMGRPGAGRMGGGGGGVGPGRGASGEPGMPGGPDGGEGGRGGGGGRGGLPEMGSDGGGQMGGGPGQTVQLVVFKRPVGGMMAPSIRWLAPEAQPRAAAQPTDRAEVFKLRNVTTADAVKVLQGNRDLANRLTIISEPVSNTIKLVGPPDAIQVALDLILQLDAGPTPPKPSPSAALVGVMADTLIEQPLATFEEVYAQVKKANPNLRLTDKTAELDSLKLAVGNRLARDGNGESAVWRTIGGFQDGKYLDRINLLDPSLDKVRAVATERWGLVLPPSGQLTHKQFEVMWQSRPLGLDVPPRGSSRNPLTTPTR